MSEKKGSSSLFVQIDEAEFFAICVQYKLKVIKQTDLTWEKQTLKWYRVSCLICTDVLFYLITYEYVYLVRPRN